MLVVRIDDSGARGDVIVVADAKDALTTADCQGDA